MLKIGKRGIWWLLFATGLAIARAVVLRVPSQSSWIGLDFYTAYCAGEVLRQGGNPYSGHEIDRVAAALGVARVQGDILGSTPFWVWFNQGFGVLAIDPRTAAWAWFLACTAIWSIGLVVTERLCATPGFASPERVRWWIKFAPFAFLPAYGSIFIGQSSPAVFTLMAIALVAESRGKTNRAAIMIGLAGAIKIFPFAAVAYFALGRRWRAVGTAAITLALLQIPALIQRPTIAHEFVKSVFVFGSAQDWKAALPANQSIRGMVARLTSENPWSAHVANPIAFNLAWGALTVCFWIFIYRKGRHLFQEFASEGLVLVTTGACCAAPFFWHHSYVILWPLFAMVISRAPVRGWLAIGLVALQHLYDNTTTVAAPIYFLPPATSLCIVAVVLLCITLGTPVAHSGPVSLPRGPRL